jgi:hypothetical protein
MEFPFNIYSLKEGDTHTIPTQPQGCLRHIEWSTHHLQRCIKYWAGPNLSAIHGTGKLPAKQEKKKELVLLRLRNHKNRLDLYKK